MIEKPGKPFRLKDRAKSFGFAFRGIAWAFKTQHNIWIHAAVAVAVIALGFWLHLSRTEWLLVVLSIGFVIAAELFNSAVELLVDLVSPEHNPKAGLVKDIAAGAVLVSAIAAALTGLVIFVPKIADLCSW